LKIVVCAKQVATLGDEIEFTDDGRDVDPDFLERTLNEWDVFALEEALRIAEASADESSEVVAVTVGAEESEEALRRCLAMGAARAVRVEAEGVDALDPLTIARRLAQVVSEESPDLVLCGVQTSDSVQAATGTMLAELLGLPRVTVVTKIAYEHAARRAVVHRELEGGIVDVVEVDTPAVLTVQTGINEPRYATLRAIKQAQQQEIRIVEPGPPEPGAYRVRSMAVPERGAGAEMLGDDAATVATRISELVKARLS
jgi:electron transfer flavoprotein beta subunit